MNNPESVIIVNRFFEALDLLKDKKIIRGRNSFTSRYGINRANLYQLDKDRSRDIFQPSWLTFLVRDYNISPAWLLTGQGTPLPIEED